MSLSEYFDYVVDGEIKKIGIKRGGKLNGKPLGKNSPDSTYISLGLYPRQGEKPVFDASTHTCTGPTRAFDADNQVVVYSWSVNEIPLADLKETAKKAVTDNRESRQIGVIPITISSGTFNYPYSELYAMQHFGRWQAITAGVSSLPSYWRDEDDNNNAVVLNDFLVMAGAINDYLMALGAESHAVKARIDAATDKETIDAEVEAYKTYDPLA